MRHHLETKFNKTLPGHTEDVMVTFNQPPDPNKPIVTYFAKQNKCISLLENSDEPIIPAKQKRTLLGHMQKIPTYQQVVADYNKDVKQNGAKTWDETRLFFVAENLNITDDLSALSKAGIGSAHIFLKHNKIYVSTSYRQHIRYCTPRMKTMTSHSQKWPMLSTKQRRIHHLQPQQLHLQNYRPS